MICNIQQIVITAENNIIIVADVYILTQDYFTIKQHIHENICKQNHPRLLSSKFILISNKLNPLILFIPVIMSFC